MSKLCGKALEPVELDEKDKESKTADLASVLTNLRSKIVTTWQRGI